MTNSDLIGSIPEWGNIVLSLGGFLLLYTTLKSQIRVQQLQQSIAEIEIRKYLEEIKPDFIIEVKDFEVVNYRNGTEISLIPIDNLAKDISYEFTQCSPGLSDKSGHQGNIGSFYHQLNEPIKIIFVWDEYFDDKGLITSLDITYFDKIGTKYLLKFAILYSYQNLPKAGPIIKSYPSLMKPFI